MLLANKLNNLAVYSSNSTVSDAHVLFLRHLHCNVRVSKSLLVEPAQSSCQISTMSSLSFSRPLKACCRILQLAAVDLRLSLADTGGTGPSPSTIRRKPIEEPQKLSLHEAIARSRVGSGSEFGPRSILWLAGEVCTWSPICRTSHFGAHRVGAARLRTLL